MSRQKSDNINQLQKRNVFYAETKMLKDGVHDDDFYYLQRQQQHTSIEPQQIIRNGKKCYKSSSFDL